MTITRQQYETLNDRQKEMMRNPDVLRIIAREISDSGDRLHYPQPEEWHIYEGKKYVVGDVDSGWLGMDGKHEGQRYVLAWTPHLDIAEMLRDKLLTCGWKYRFTSVITVNAEWLKQHDLLVATAAGFFEYSVIRGEEKTVIIGPSDILNKHHEEVLANG